MPPHQCPASIPRQPVYEDAPSPPPSPPPLIQDYQISEPPAAPPDMCIYHCYDVLLRLRELGQGVVCPIVQLSAEQQQLVTNPLTAALYGMTIAQIPEGVFLLVPADPQSVIYTTPCTWPQGMGMMPKFQAVSMQWRSEAAESIVATPPGAKCSLWVPLNTRSRRELDHFTAVMLQAGVARIVLGATTCTIERLAGGCSAALVELAVLGDADKYASMNCVTAFETTVYSSSSSSSSSSSAEVAEAAASSCSSADASCSSSSSPLPG